MFDLILLHFDTSSSVFIEQYNIINHWLNIKHVRWFDLWKTILGVFCTSHNIDKVYVHCSNILMSHDFLFPISVQQLFLIL